MVPIREVANITINLEDKLIEGDATIYLNIKERTDKIVLSAAEMLWETFSVSLTSENQELIPIHNYEIRESRFPFLQIISRRTRRRDSPGLRTRSGSLYAANLVRSSHSNRSDGLLSELRKRPALRNDPIRAEFRSNLYPHL